MNTASPEERKRKHTELIIRQLISLDANQPRILTERADNVYILKAGDCYKIGRTSDLWKRIKTIRTSNPGLEWIQYKLVADAVDFELRLHRILDCYLINGEWFKLPDVVIPYLTINCIKVEHLIK